VRARVVAIERDDDRRGRVVSIDVERTDDADD